LAGGGNGNGGGGGSSVAAGGGGSTNLDQGSGPGDQYHGDAFVEGSWAKVYAPREVDGIGQKERVAGQVGDGPAAGRAEFLAPATTGQSYVDYEKAWTAARQRSEESLSKQKIPARDRKLIRDYFGL
jgi:hypothetical protein